jgi:hypothetical protein
MGHTMYAAVRATAQYSIGVEPGLIVFRDWGSGLGLQDFFFSY